MRPFVICSRCHRSRQHRAKGMCSGCYTGFVRELARLEKKPVERAMPTVDTSWMVGTPCAAIGAHGWEALNPDDQATVCQSCPLIDPCRKYAREIGAHDVVYAAVMWRNGKPRPSRATVPEAIIEANSDDPREVAKACGYSDPKNLRRALREDGRPLLAAAIRKPAVDADPLAGHDSEALRAAFHRAIADGDDTEALRIARLRSRPIRAA